MTELSIRFNAGYGEERVPVRIRRIDFSAPDAVEWFRDIRVVAENPSSLEVDPGLYVVEAFWRNGRMTSQRLAVESSPVEFVLVPPAVARRAKPSDRDYTQPSAGGMSWSSRRSNDGYIPTVFRSSKQTWTLLCDRQALHEASNITAEHRPVRRLHDVHVRATDADHRNWVLYWASDAWAVSSLPRSNGDVEEVTLRSDPLDLPYVAASDPDLGVMTDLLPSGNAEAAHRYASVAYGHARSHDFENFVLSRPLELCAFAYAEYEMSSESEWMKVVERLSSAHSDIPDVAVLLGWRALMAASSEDQWRMAGTLFERAVEIGVPFYALGVRLLAEGLTMLAPTLDGHSRSAELVRAVASRIVPTEAFTTVRL